jgi:hypothetical protein
LSDNCLEYSLNKLSRRMKPITESVV